MFVISAATTSSLSLAASGSSSISSSADLLSTSEDSHNTGSLGRATPRHWLWQRLSVVAVALSIAGAAGGWALLAAGVAAYNLHDVLMMGKSGNIRRTRSWFWRHRCWLRRLTAYVTIGIFVVMFTGGYLFRLRPRVHMRIQSYDFGHPVA